MCVLQLVDSLKLMQDQDTSVHCSVYGLKLAFITSSTVAGGGGWDTSPPYDFIHFFTLYKRKKFAISCRLPPWNISSYSTDSKKTML